jgi:predicted amidohydrolase
MYSSKDKLDVILFPEMTFTGYNFKDQEDAMPLSIKKDEG